jgi:hypothetical protein
MGRDTRRSIIANGYQPSSAERGRAALGAGSLAGLRRPRWDFARLSCLAPAGFLHGLPVLALTSTGRKRIKS